MITLSNRKDAIAAGDTTYFTGKPCKHGHIARRRVDNCMCSECGRLQSYERSLLPHVKKANKINKQKPEYKKKQSEYSKSSERRAVVRELSKLPENAAKKQAYRDKNRGKTREYLKAYYTKNRADLIAKGKVYNAKNKDRRREYIRAWAAEYRATPNGRAIGMMRKHISRMLTVDKIGGTEEILGYNRGDFVAHIESIFSEGMTWDNHGEWHVDHKEPIISFINKDINDPKIINALENLQPLWAFDNLSKGSKF